MGKPAPFIFILMLALPLALCACNREQSAAPPPAAVPSGVYDVPGEDAGEAPSALSIPTPTPATDGLEGSYYNDFLRLTLTLDGEGSFTMLTRGGTGDTGTYAAGGEAGTLTLSFPSGQENAVIDADGDLTIEGRTGYFLRDWSYWHITAAEAGTEPVPLPYEGNATVLDNGDGTFRYRDPDNALAFTYPAGMTAQSGRLIGGVVVTDSGGGAVAGRNVTALYSTHKGTDDEFLADYVHTFVFTDFGILYGGVRSYQPLTLLHEGIEGRLAAATMALRGSAEETEIFARIILYTSTYADGTVNYICKTVFAADANRIDELSDAVTDMGAVRIR